MKFEMPRILTIVLGLASLGLFVQVANAEKGKDCIADHAACKAAAKHGSEVELNACVKQFNQCVSKNKEQGLNPYGNPARFGGGPAVLKDVAGVSIGKPAAASMNPGTAATTTTNIGTFGGKAINPAAAATTTTGAATLAAPVKPFTSFSKGVSGGASITQPGRSNLRVQ
jgi:hypothetical protein